MTAPKGASLETVIADWREKANVLRACRRPHDAELVEEIVEQVAAAAEDFTRWIGEPDARMRSGKGLAWFRAQFPAWAEQGHARTNPRGVREYRLCVVPQRPHLSAAREAGRQAGRAAGRRAAGQG